MGVKNIFVCLGLLVFNGCHATDIESFFTADEYLYHFMDDFDLTFVAGQTWTIFKVRACNDARVLLMQDGTDFDANVYEIVIGGLSNTKSWISESRMGCPVVSTLHTPLHCNFLREFWIRWASDTIEVGTGSVVGSGQFLSYTDATPSNVNYMAVSTGLGATGHWVFDCEAATVHGTNCQELLEDGITTSGVYTIQPCASCDVFDVFCDMDTDGGGWEVFQRREDGSVDFLRNWTDYRDGFGSLTGEFWLGLEHIYQIVSQGSHELRVDMDDWVPVSMFAHYGTFDIGPESDKYRLTIGGYTAGSPPGDSLAYQNNRQFTTPDNDNDAYSGNCADLYQGRWWYNHCHHSNLNGLYIVDGNHATYAIGINWKTWHGYYYSLKKTEMKTRAT